MATAKRIRVSTDNTTYYTLPGNTGSIANDLGTIEDTVFGQLYKSTQPGAITTKITTQAYYKGFAGYVAKLKMHGTSTAFTAEATTNTAGKSYQITDATKRVIDRSVTLTVYDNAVAVSSSNILSIDYLFGIVTLASTYTVTGPITVSGNYLPMVQIAAANSFTLTQSADAIDTSDFETLQANDGYKTFEQGLKTVSLELKGFYSAVNDFTTKLQGRAEYVVEIAPDGNAAGSVARGFFKITSDSLSGNVGALEEDSLKMSLSVPDNDFMVYPFAWMHGTSSTLNQGVQKALTAFTAGTNIYAQYLPNGTTGWQGSGPITEATLTGGVDAMNSYAFTIQVSGALTTVS